MPGAGRVSDSSEPTQPRNGLSLADGSQSVGCSAELTTAMEEARRTQPSRPTLIFVLGAGFNADAAEEAGPVYGESIYIGRHQIECGYPLVNDLARLCFGTNAPPSNASIEDLFASALEQRNYAPMIELAKTLMKADYYLVPRLLPTRARLPTCYAAFFARFGASSFLTFNQDSLVNLFLRECGKWFPHDGFGVPVRADFRPGLDRPTPVGRSTSLVLHLHGSLCLYTSDVEFRAAPSGPRTHNQVIVPRESPDYVFDPDSIGNLYEEYARPQLLDRKPVERRVVAPVPDKTSGLQQSFIQRVYSRAAGLLMTADEVVAIGYSFNPHDQASYEPLLRAVSGNRRHSRVLVVAPDAVEVRARLCRDYPHIDWCSAPLTFKSWVALGFPGVGHDVGSR